MKTSAGRGGCYTPSPKAEVVKTLRDLQNSLYPTKASFNNCYIIHFKIFSSLKLVNLLAAISLFVNNTTSSPGFLGQRFNNLQRDALLTSLILCKFGQQQLVMVNYACGFNQSETGNYFE